jgi:flagellar biosynthetic protein FlhB
MPEQAAERTEQPTGRVLNKARGKGQVPQSQELTSAVSLIVLVAIITLLAPNLLQWLMLQIRQGMSCEKAVFTDSGAFLHFINRKIVDLALTIAPILAALVAGGLMRRGL